MYSSETVINHGRNVAPPPKYRKVSLILAAVMATFSTGCQTTQGANSNVLKENFASDDPCSNNARNIGMVTGAILGGVIANKVSSKNKALNTTLGAGLGAALGGFIGSDIDRRRCELHQVAKANNLSIVVADIKPAAAAPEAPSGAPVQSSATSRGATVGLSVSVIDTGEQFASGSSRLSPKAAKAFSEIADKYLSRASANASNEDRAAAQTRNQQIRILLVGHTDDTGSSQLNADLSEARAREVAKIFASKGFQPSQIFYQGAGETLPIGDNSTEAGRSKNRRVEIVDMSEDGALAAFLDSRRPNLAFYRPAEAVTTPASAPAVAPGHHKSPSGDKSSTTVGDSKISRPGDDQRPRPAVAPAQAVTPSTSPVASTAAAKSPSANTSSAAPPSAGGTRENVIDFGGTSASSGFKQVDIGKPARSSVFSVVSSAYASDSSPVGSCAQDRPRVANGVKTLQGDQLAKLSTSEFMPGLANSSWAGNVNGHLVALTNVAVLRDGGAPARRPNLMVYTDYKGDANPKAAYRGTPEVNAYQGEKAVLYRVFAESPLRCMDIVIPNSNPRAAPNSNLVYQRSGQTYQVAFNPSIAR